MGGYRGMRWFKCDLHVQTPEDGRHWDREDPLRLPNPRQEQDLQAKARHYLRRCHEVGLEVIGVTDHNFCAHRRARERFLAHLIEQNASVAEEKGRDPLWIFPGFEIDIGFHVLCLFPPLSKGSGLDSVCDVLTKLGLTPETRFTENGPADLRRGDYVALSEILRVVQVEHGGIVIAAHAFERDGICDQSGRWAGDYQNEDLLCVEVSQLPLGPREKAILEAASGKWVRRQPPAYIRSSDTKSTLVDPEGHPRPNSLGYRSTWIKMSEPSIEALRQAFLDWRSRIRLEGDPRIVRHDWIDSLSVRNVAFLRDQEVVFSPHLNCLIGGRGSGKSSLLESIRFALRREDEPAAREQVARIQETLTPGSVLTLVWREQDSSSGARGPEDVFEFQPSAVRARIVSREVVDASTVFEGLGVRIFSQRQISEVARHSDFLLTLIDDLAGSKLQALRQRETELKERIRHLQQEQQILDRLRNELRALEQEVGELDRRWAARSAVQEEQKRHRTAQEAARYLENVEEKTIRIEQDLDRWTVDLVEGHSPLGSVAKSWPEPAYFEQLDSEIEKAKQQLTNEIRQAADRYRHQISELTVRSADWSRVQDAIRQAEQDFREACSRQGLQPEDLEQLFQLDLQRKAKSLELETKRAQAGAIEKSVASLGELWKLLFNTWKEQTASRSSEIKRILESEAVPKVPKLVAGRAEGERPSLEVEVRYAANRETFLREWAGLAPADARTRLGKQWENLGAAAFDSFLASGGESPWEIVEGWRHGEIPKPDNNLADLLPLLKSHLGTIQERWEIQRLVRIPDAVDLVLYRDDGTEAGSLRRKQLSEGQTNTALLMLLLASGTGPILIDQPEDELDANFISRQLVPLLREIKNRRQVIVVTHNPNLPVNADAELVYALQAENLGGRARGVVRAQGGLDREPVKRAVLDIMEGSEEAFRKRQEKYHF